MELVSRQHCFGGWQTVCSHDSSACHCKMTFGLYLPPQAETQRVPVLWFLSGLTCTHENAMTKAGFQGFAAKHGLALVYPDTSPRGDAVADDDAYDLGQGAGFYLNATQEPWCKHFRMHDYLVDELPAFLESKYPCLDLSQQGIFGHSMGGHGALCLAFRNPDRFQSVSAFAPICHPSNSEWGRTQLAAYLGPNSSDWSMWDASTWRISDGIC